MPKLYRVEEIAEPGTLSAGTYIAIRDCRVIMHVEIDRPTRPGDLIPAILKATAA